MMFGSLNWLAPVAAQGEGSPESVATTEPAATSTTVPPTEIPLPTETPVSASTETPVSTEIPVATETTEPAVTPTDVPEEELEAAAPVWLFAISFLVCDNSERMGQTEFQFTGEFTAANTVLECRSPEFQFPDGLQVTLTPLAGGPVVVISLDDFGGGQGQGFAPGDYSVTVSTTGYSASMSSGISLPDDSIRYLNIFYFVEAAPADPPPAEELSHLTGVLANCVDPARDGETDFFIADSAAANAEQCQEYHGFGQDKMTLTQVSGTDPYGPVTINVEGSQFTFGSVPSGTYTLTNGLTGNVSEPFDVSYPWYTSPNVRVVNYFATAPEPNPVVTLSKYVCGNAERAGQVDYVILDAPDFLASDTCIVEPSTSEFTITLNSIDAPYNQSLTVTTAEPGDAHFFVGVTPGTYTVQETGKPASEPFTIAAVDSKAILVTNFVEPTSAQPTATAAPGEGTTSFYGSYVYCSSVERDGEVEFSIDNGVYSGAATGECSYGETSPGIFTMTRYDDTSGTILAESWTDNGQNGTFYFFGLVPGYYRLAFQASTISEPVVSDVFQLYKFTDPSGFVQIYQGVIAAPVIVNKEFCYDPARDGQTDFFVESAQPSFNAEASTTTTCRQFDYDDEEITFTLTNTETGDEVTATIGEFDGGSALFGAMPPGTYTLTETSIGYNATSEPFTIELGGSGYTIFVRNYTSEVREIENPSDYVSLQLSAFNCLNDVRDGEFDYFFTPSDFGAGATEECDASGEGEYSFVLIGDAFESEPDSFAAQATYNLSPIPGSPNTYTIDDGGNGEIQPGSYVIQETTTGFTSAPLSFETYGNDARFYVYAAAPTPTPTPTETPIPTETPTPTPTVPGVTPTVVTGTVEPGGGTTPTIEDPADPGGVTTLPSTGQGSGSNTSASLLILLTLAAALLLGGAIRTKRR
jgi:hypothetical protein